MKGMAYKRKQKTARGFLFGMFKGDDKGFALREKKAEQKERAKERREEEQIRKEFRKDMRF